MRKIISLLLIVILLVSCGEKAADLATPSSETPSATPQPEQVTPVVTDSPTAEPTAEPTAIPVVDKKYVEAYYPEYELVDRIIVDTYEHLEVSVDSKEIRMKLWSLMSVIAWWVADLTDEPSVNYCVRIDEVGSGDEAVPSQSWFFAEYDNMTLIVPALPENGDEKVYYTAPIEVVSNIIAYAEALTSPTEAASDEPYSFYPVYEYITELCVGDYEDVVMYIIGDEERTELWRLLRVDEWIVATDLEAGGGPESDFTISEVSEDGFWQGWFFGTVWDKLLIIPYSPPPNFAAKICFYAPIEIIDDILAFAVSLTAQ